jgi:tol-pal system protein YbgF
VVVLVGWFFISAKVNVVSPDQYVKRPSGRSATVGSPEGETHQTPEKMYKQAMELLNAHQESAAREILQKLAESYPESALADNALYWLGESYYKEKDWEEAREYFTRVIEKYPEGNKSPDAFLKKAFTYWNQHRWKEARKELKEVMNRYPNTSLSRIAEGKLRELQKIAPPRGEGG